MFEKIKDLINGVFLMVLYIAVVVFIIIPLMYWSLCKPDPILIDQIAGVLLGMLLTASIGFCIFEGELDEPLI